MTAPYRRNNLERRLSTETKASTKSTELYVYVLAVVAVVVTAMIVGDDDHTHIDGFGAVEAVRYIVWLTIGYMVARGLAKSGSREYYDDADYSNDTTTGTAHGDH